MQGRKESSEEMIRLKHAAGIWVRKQRRIRRLTQRQFADAVGVTQATVYNWEEGMRSMSVDSVLMICKAFDLRPVVEAVEIFKEAGIS